MKKVVCSVYDVKAVCYSNPFYAPNTAVAVRDFQAAAVDPQSGISRNPEDYSLFLLATYDDETGAFENHTPPRHLISALNSTIPFGE